MANISTASGSVEIIAKIEVENAIRDAIKIAKEWDYGVILDYDHFEGHGRWNMSNTLKDLMKNVMSELQSKEPFSLNSFFFKLFNQNQREQIVKTILENDWEIMFDYVDEESGEEFIVEKQASIIHKANEPIDECKFVCNLQHSYEYTWKNLVDVCGYSIDDIFDWYDSEYLMEQIEKEAPHFGMTAAEFIKEYELKDRLNEE